MHNKSSQRHQYVLYFGECAWARTNDDDYCLCIIHCTQLYLWRDKAREHTLKQSVDSLQRQARHHIFVDNDAGAVVLCSMAQVLAEQTPWWAEGPALDPLGPLMHFQAQHGCHPSTQAVTCVRGHRLEQLIHIKCP